MAGDAKEMPSDLSEFCRVCLQLPQASQYLDLSTIYDEEDHLSYSDCFTICTQIDLKAGIGVPHHLCKSCGLELQMSYDFHKKVEESKRVIEKYEKKMQDGTNEQQLLYKPLPQKVVQKNQQQDTNEQELNDATTFFLSPMVVEGNNLPQSQKTLDLTQDEQEYLGSSDEENGVELLSKIGSIRDTVADDQENEHLVPMADCIEIEEHLEMEDFQNLETLEEEETETLQIQCEQNAIPITITKCKNKQIKDEEFYFVEEEEEDADYQTNSLEELLDDEEENNEHSKWEENVVAVANKEHIPVEAEGDEDQEVEELEYTNDFIILSDVSNGESISEKVTGEKDKESKEKNQDTIIADGSRKRHIGAHSCDYCQKMFKNYSRMTAHRRCHEADRTKYGCLHCGRMYATKQAMECHVQTAHEKSGYTCNICSKVFAIRKSLEIHVRYHTGDFPYVCDICGRKFAQSGHLNTHKNVKHNNIRFSCDYPDCAKVFTSSTSLRNHEFSHGIMPFECEYCQLGYPAKTKLRVHIKRKHNLDLNMEQLEQMRKFHVMRSKVNVVKVVEVEEKT